MYRSICFKFCFKLDKSSAKNFCVTRRLIIIKFFDVRATLCLVLLIFTLALALSCLRGHHEFFVYIPNTFRMFSRDARQEINLLCLRVNNMTAVTPSPLKTKLYFDNDFIIDFFHSEGEFSS